MKLLQSSLDKVYKLLKESILDSEVEFEYKYNKVLSNETFTKLRNYLSETYTKDATTITLDISFDNDDIRVTLEDIESIKSYCKSENIDKTMNTTYIEKKRIDNITLDDIRINSKREINLDDDSYQIEEIKKSWKTLNKSYRYKYRFSFVTSDNLFSIDLTAVKSTDSLPNKYSKSFKSSKVLNANETYELEVEYIGNEHGIIYNYITGNVPEIIPSKQKKKQRYEDIENKLDGLNYTDYLPTLSDVLNKAQYKMGKRPRKDTIERYQLDILKMYIHNNPTLRLNKSMSKSQGNIREIKPKLLYNIDNYYLDYDIVKQSSQLNNTYNNLKIMLSKDSNALDGVIEILDETITKLHMVIYETELLIPESEKQNVWKQYYKLTNQTNKSYKGLRVPQPVTLSQSELNPENPKNILLNYSVTEKADGERYVLYINETHYGYLLNNKGNVLFTGIEFKVIGEWILDGEYILRDKEDRPINLYKIFDVYHADDNRVSIYPFKTSKGDSRDNYLQEFRSILKDIEYIEDVNNPLRIELKDYKTGSRKKDPSKILRDSLDIYSMDFEYKTDGLIYLPTTLPVGADIDGGIPDSIEGSWNLNYKWKPPELNTIDFSVTIEKDGKRDKIIAVTINGKPEAYKTLLLKNKYNISKDNYTNFCNMMIHKIPNSFPPDKKNFLPDVSDKEKQIINLSRANILLRNGKMYTEMGEEIRNGDIVEMRFYDKNKDDGEKTNHNMIWEPLRLRNDKPSENTYDTAMKVWETIKERVTIDMISGKEIINFKKYELSNEYYGEKRNSTSSEPLRLLHNYIKLLLIRGIGSSGDLSHSKKIMDTSIGQGGDLQKYFSDDVHCTFLFGLDKSPVNEACHRYVEKQVYNRRIRKSKPPLSIFIQFDTSKNIIEKEGLLEEDEYQRNIINSIYGNGTIDKKYSYIHKELNEKGTSKFTIISCQFSLHYYFETKLTLMGYIRNITENCKKNGYFIGCCYNGKRIFERLKDSEPFEYKNKHGSIIYKIEKKYDMETFEYTDNDDEMFGNKITVEMESIGKPIDEYLVNFDYFTKIMNDNGFELHVPNMKDKYDITNPIGSFTSIIDTLEKRTNRIDGDKRLKSSESLLNILKDDKLKELSSMNDWFIYKKIRE